MAAQFGKNLNFILHPSAVVSYEIDQMVCTMQHKEIEMSNQIESIFARLPGLFVARSDLRTRSEKARATLLLEAGEDRVRLRIADGAVTVLPANGPMDGWDIALRADSGAWYDHWQAIPAPDAFDIFGMVRRGRMRIEGDFTPLMRHLQLIKDILALPRAAA
ncbi:hypothetical protein [Roseovarius sp. MMSF_3281]|uniref:hypothetical protein n=1 Tax=Roseovarius sp. MMSF_3281 TaxID=3046694 RepID=UPI00273DF067|nr:hypothetical protein [Roseovarius sp. MMSF_3281]